MAFRALYDVALETYNIPRLEPTTIVLCTIATPTIYRLYFPSSFVCLPHASHLFIRIQSPAHGGLF